MATQADQNSLVNNPKAFENYLKLGRLAQREGDFRRAARYYRRAAVADPYSEQVWLALLEVVETDEDRRVCLQNIIAINPDHSLVRSRIGLHGQAQKRWPLSRIFFWIVMIPLFGFLIAVVILVFQFLLN